MNLSRIQYLLEKDPNSLKDSLDLKILKEKKLINKKYLKLKILGKGELKKNIDIISLVGNTPLIKLNGPSAATGCQIYGKAEFLNPGQSIKDRAALYIIKDAEEKGLLKPGGTVVEGTAGNTGIGLVRLVG